MKKHAFIALLVTSVMLVAGSLAQEDNSELIERIKPIGKIKLAGASSSATPDQAAGPRSGEQIYNAACVACHASGVLGAPKNQIAADWQPRLDEKGFDQVWQNAINGINAMPAMGTCGDCSDEDIKLAIEYMLEGI